MCMFIYVYIYIYRERERERYQEDADREPDQCAQGVMAPYGIEGYVREYRR